VFATKLMIETAIEYINRHPNELLHLNKKADKNTIKKYFNNREYFPLTFKRSGESSPFLFKGLKFNKEKSAISGKTKIIYSDEKVDFWVPFFNEVVTEDSLIVPEAYFIPAEWGMWNNIIERIKLHGIKVEQTETEMKIEATRYKFRNIKFSAYPYEGRHQAYDPDYIEYSERIIIPRGTYRINTDQRAIRIIIHLLEPKSGDSFLQWGFFNQIFEQKEYFEDYLMEKLALEMIAKDSSLKEEFENKLKNDSEFADDPNKRLNFFYERSPYFDRQMNIYPVIRMEKPR
jgi:hypothetical protein